jgi:tetratricopeptide (TPR) repeat protein
MADYYEVLGLGRDANSTQIRMAYKRLAMLYHPDRNPGNPQAEENFKLVYAAYHTLADPLKKARYDARLYSFQGHTFSQEELWREARHRQYQRWRTSQRTNQYQFDREYFRIQGLAFLVFIIISGFCFAVIHTGQYLAEQHNIEVQARYTKILVQVNSLFNTGEVDEAFGIIEALRKQDPLEIRFMTAEDSLLMKLRALAENHFQNQQTEQSLVHYKLLQKYELAPRIETLRKVAECELLLHRYPDAVASLKQLYKQQPWSLELPNRIAQINLVHLHNAPEALEYFTLAKVQFKKKMEALYGEAFLLVINPTQLPEVCNEIFAGRAEANRQLGYYEEALKDCNWLVILKPAEPGPYLLRAKVKAEAQLPEGICEDLANARKFGSQETRELSRQYCR